MRKPFGGPAAVLLLVQRSNERRRSSASRENRKTQAAWASLLDVDEVFVIMQIGNAQLDEVCDEAIDPAIVDAEFPPRRVARHNEGDLLKSEIVQLIERCQVIVADVTKERPNCYLEIGYAMGLGKLR